MTNKTGVQEWANHSINLQYTCEYGCKYCYARKLNNRFKFQPKEPVIKHYNGVIMLPTMHDITTSNFVKCAYIIEKLLEYDNKILIVSKIDFWIAECFYTLFKWNEKAKQNIEFRLTVTSSDQIKRYFEPHAPQNTFQSLDLLRRYFKCSISIEPLLQIDILKNAVKRILPLPIWVGCLTNYKLNPGIPEEKAVIDLYRTLPEIYEEYKKYDFIKFKDSFFKAMNRELKRREKIHIKKVKGLCCAIGDCVKESKLYCQRCHNRLDKKWRAHTREKTKTERIKNDKNK